MAAFFILADRGLIAPPAWCRRWSIGWLGFIGIAAICIIGFTIQVVMELRRATAAAAEAESDEERERILEEIMVPALECRTELPDRVSDLLAYPAAVAVGLLAGCVLSWVVDLARDLVPY